MEELKIIKITVKGYAGIDEIEILNPPDWMIEFFSRENGEGKSSLVEALQKAMGGGTIPSGVIRDGADHAEVEVLFESAQIRCTIARERGKTLSVKVRDAKSGKLRALPSGQQGYLDGMIGTMLDPASFAAMGDEKRRELVKSLTTPEWLKSRADLYGAVKAAEEDRLVAGRSVTSFGVVEPVAPAEPVDVAALAEELRKADAANRRQLNDLSDWARAKELLRHEWEQKNAEAEAAWERSETTAKGAWDNEQARRADAIEGCDALLSRERRNVERLRSELASAEEEVRRLESARGNLPEPERQSPAQSARPIPCPEPDYGPQPVVTELDTSDLRQRLAEATERNRAAALYERYLERVEERKKLVAAHEAAEAAVAEARCALAAYEKTATLPAGLAIGETGLAYQDRPMHRMSTGEGYVLAFDIAAARGQKILVADNAEALGPKSVETITALARERHIWVIFCTRGTPHTPGAYELRNGRLVEAV